MTTPAALLAHPSAAGDGQFLGVDWGLFVLVFLVTLVAGVVIVVLVSTGLRLRAAALGEEGEARQRNGGLLTGAYVCFGLAGLGVLAGLWLVIPQFHG